MVNNENTDRQDNKTAFERMNEQNQITAFDFLAEHLQEDSEKLNLYKIKDALGISEKDSLWAIFVALSYHNSLYREIPDKIMMATEMAVAKAKEEASRQIQEEADRQKQNLIEIAQSEIKRTSSGANQAIKRVEDSARKVINATTIKPWVKVWHVLIVLVLVLICCLAGMGIGAFLGG